MIKDIPASSPEGKDWTHLQLLKLTSKYSISNILDVGCGAGTYYNYFNSVLPGATWTGIEIWEPYVEEFKLASIYNNLIIADAGSIDYQSLGTFDVAFCGDVLEHMEEASAIKVVQELCKISKFVLISIPIVHYPCTEYEHNPYLRHVKDDWSDGHVMSVFGQYVKRKQLGTIVGTYLLSAEDIIETDDLWLIINDHRLNENLEMFIRTSCQYISEKGEKSADVLDAMRYMYARPEVSGELRTLISWVL